MYTKIVKPLADFFAALIGLILLSPLFLLITILLFIANNGKPFFFNYVRERTERFLKLLSSKR